MDVRVGLWRKLSTKELMLLNCGVGEDSSESLGLQGDPTVHPKGDQSWVFIGRTDAEAETLVLWPPHVKSWLIGKDRDAGRDLGAGGEGDDRGWDGWMASPTWRTWVWANAGSLWWTGRPGVLQFMGFTESDTTEQLNWTELKFLFWKNVMLIYFISLLHPPKNNAFQMLTKPKGSHAREVVFYWWW